MSIRVKAMFVLIAIILFIAAANFLSGLYFTKSALKKTLGRDLEFAIGIADTLLSTRMNLIKAEAIAIAGRLEKAESNDGMRRLMEEQMRTLPPVSPLTLFDRNGVIVNHSVPPHDHGANISPKYRAMVYDGATMISSPFYCAVQNEYVMNACTPMEGGRILAVTIPGQTYASVFFLLIQEVLLRGECFHRLVRDMPAADQVRLARRGVRAVLLMPIFLQNAFWGFAALDNRHSEELFTDNEDLPRLFSDYNQVDMGTNCKIGGTGLGLAITKRLAEMMDGRVSIESEYGKGSIFSVRLRQMLVSADPIGRVAAGNLMQMRYSVTKRDRNAQLTRAKLPYARVLVVDDVVTNLDVVRGMMKLYEMKIDCAASGRQAVEMIRAEKRLYNAVFMDHMMPGMDGMEAARIIREEIDTEYARTIPIIALTADAIVGTEEMFLNSGFQDFIFKPIDMAKLDAVLRRWVGDEGRDNAIPE